MNLVHQFKKRIPWWIFDTRQVVKKKVEESPIIQGCANGDTAHIHYLLLGFWPVIETFQNTLKKTSEDIQNSIQMGVVGRHFGPRVFEDFDAIVNESAMSGIQNIESDESVHRTLWRDAAHAIGIFDDDLSCSSNKPIKEILALNAYIFQNHHYWVRLLKYLGVEMVAEYTSQVLLDSQPFLSQIGESNVEWFRRYYGKNHEEVGGMTHEELEFRLSMVFYLLETGEEEIQQREGHDIIFECVNHFARAGKALSAIASTPHYV